MELDTLINILFTLKNEIYLKPSILCFTSWAMIWYPSFLKWQPSTISYGGTIPCLMLSSSSWVAVNLPPVSHETPCDDGG